MVHKDRTGPLGDLGKGDQPSGKVCVSGPIVLRKFLHKQAWKQVYDSRGLAPGAYGLLKRGEVRRGAG